MATVSAMKAALKTAAATISGLDAHASEPLSMGSKPVGYPRLVPSLREFDVAFNGAGVWAFDFWVIVPVGDRDLNRAETTMDPYLSETGTNSLKAAIEADPSLGGVVDSVRVTGLSNYGMTQFEGAGQHLAASVRVEVYE